MTARFPDQLTIPNEVLRIAMKLEDAGFETWCVGGAVRDNLLGFENTDFDLATAARPEEVQRLFRRTVPVGVEHGTVAVLDRRNRLHEVTTFRRDVVTDGRHAIVQFGVSLDEDLARRDFTINAIAYQPLRHEWRDRFDGAADLERKLIRAVGDPAQRFREDYLRILRMLRFAARFGFTIVPATWEAAKANVAGLEHLSAERVRDEWFKGLKTAVRPSELVRLGTNIGAVEQWLAGVSGERWAGADVAAALDRFQVKDPVLMTAYLSADPVATLTRLRSSNADLERGRRIAEHREHWPDPASPAAVRRWMAAAGLVVDDLVAIARAEGRGEPLAKAVTAVRKSGAPLAVSDLAIDGKDLMKAGIPEGPAVGQTLRRLLDAVLEEPGLNTKRALLQKARGE